MTFRFFIFSVLPALLIALLISGEKAIWIYHRVQATPNAVRSAEDALKDYLGEAPSQGSLVVVDFTLPSQAKRLKVIDLATGETRLHGRCAHGKNTGHNFAEHFSNQPRSYRSSLGLFRIAEPYFGKNGPSIRLDGLSRSLNSNARRRNLVIHAADYVETWSIFDNFDEGLRLGRSLGCFVLTDAQYQLLEGQLTRPAYLYAYGDEDEDS